MDNKENLPAAFNPAQLMDKLKENIRATVLGMIPDETLDEMIKAEVAAFFEPGKATRKYQLEAKPGDSSWNPTRLLYVEEITEESPFRRIVWDYMIEQTKVALIKHIDSNYFTEQIGSTKVKENMAEIFEMKGQALISGFFQNIFAMQSHMLRQDIMIEVNNQFRR